MTKNKKIGLAFIVVPAIILLSSTGYGIAAMLSSPELNAKDLITKDVSSADFDLGNAEVINKGTEVTIRPASSEAFLAIVLSLFRAALAVGFVGLCIGIPCAIYFFRKKEKTETQTLNS